MSAVHTHVVVRPLPPSGISAAIEQTSFEGLRPTLVRHDGPIAVLVVDDDARVRTAIIQTLALEPDLMVVADAGDAETALVRAELVNPWLALVDVFLPDRESGLALIRGLSQRPGCSVVAMSIRGGHRREALTAGAVAFVEKGGDIEAILGAIRAASPRNA